MGIAALQTSVLTQKADDHEAALKEIPVGEYETRLTVFIKWNAPLTGCESSRRRQLVRRAADVSTLLHRANQFPQFVVCFTAVTDLTSCGRGENAQVRAHGFARFICG